MADKLMEDIKQSIKELVESQKKTEEVMREVGEAQKVTEAEQQKTEAAQQKTEAAQQKTTESLRDFKREMAQALEKFKKETKEALHGAVGEFNEKWSTFMENLVKEDLLNLMQEKGIAVHELHSNVEAMSWGKKKRNRLAEFDLLAVNGDELVVVETKTTLFTKDVVAFVEKLKKFKSYFSTYQKSPGVWGRRLYGGEQGGQGQGRCAGGRGGTLCDQVSGRGSGHGDSGQCRGFHPKSILTTGQIFPLDSASECGTIEVWICLS